MAKPKFEHLRIVFTVTDRHGMRVHHGHYWLDNDSERRAFGQRCHEAMRDGYTVISRREDANTKPMWCPKCGGDAWENQFCICPREKAQ